MEGRCRNKYIEEKVSLPIVHIADSTANQIQKSNISTVGILGEIGLLVKPEVSEVPLFDKALEK
ncbi:hypothetical protein [Peribacillus sp. Bi96]|uniref:hypothetical protein n=1 Tax=Peribacillus sp. Bi96 TaxID=2884273 RepID=UPI0033AFBEE6